MGIYKNQETHKLEDFLQTGVVFNDHLMNAAYGTKGLGMPILGNRANVHYLNSHVLQRFQRDNINPGRIFVCAAGIENHQEFVDLAEHKLGFIPAADGNVKQREKTAYLGGEARTTTQGNDLSIGLAFESVNWKDNNMVTFNLISSLLGQSSTINPKGLGNGLQSRVYKNIVNKHHFVDSVSAMNFHYSDSGMFGMQITGAASNVQHSFSINSLFHRRAATSSRP